MKASTVILSPAAIRRGPDGATFSFFVMAGLVPAIHVLLSAKNTWMPGARGMTVERSILVSRTCRCHLLGWSGSVQIPHG
jgi:hypothetical protein